MSANIFDEAKNRIANGQSKYQQNAPQTQTNIFDAAKKRIANGTSKYQADNAVTSASKITKPSQQADRAIQATLADIGSGNRSGQTLMQQATTPGIYDNTARKIDRAKNRANSVRNELSSRLAEETASGQPILDPLRDKLKKLEQQQAELEAKREQEKAQAWEQKQKASIDAVGNAQLLDELRQLNDLEALVKANKGMVQMTGGTPWSTQTEQDYWALQKRLSDQYGESLGAWKDYARRVENREQAEKTQTELTDAAKENPFWWSLGTLPLNMGSGIGFLDAARQRIKQKVTGSDTPIDYNTPAMLPSQATNAIRGSVSEKIEADTAGKLGSNTPLGNLYSGAYNLGMSMGDSVMGIAAGGNPIFQAGAAATNAMNDAISRGATTDQALMFGLTSAAMEGVMEKLSLDSLFNMTDTKTVKQLALNALKQGGVEATEEAATNIANTVADAVIMGNKSQLQTSVRDYISSGYSPEQAEKKALSDWGKGLLTDAIGGFISGEAFGAAGSVVNYAGNRNSGPMTQTQVDRAIQQTLGQNKIKETQSPQPWADDSRRHGVKETASSNNSTPGSTENVNDITSRVRQKYHAYAMEHGQSMENYKKFLETLTNEERNALEGWANSENVNGTVGDMGAKTSDFKHEVKQSQTARNSIGQNESRWEVPEDQRASGDYTAVTERESLNNARIRLEQDPAGEREVLRRAAVWSNEEVDMGMLILGGLRLKAKESGDWSEYRNWAKVVKQHGVSSGQALQAWAKYTRRTGDGIMQTVSELLELPEVSQKTNKDEVLHTASVYADQFDDAVAARDVAGLVQLIQDTAIERKTKKRWGKKLGGEIDWALKRIAQKADAEVRSAMNQEGTGELKNYEFLRNFAAAGIEDIAGDLAKPSVGEMAMSLRRNAMLSKFATFMRNFVGNGVFDGADMLSRDISVPLDMLLSKFTGTRSVAADRGALSKEGRDGMADGLAMALLEVGLDVNAGGAESKYERSANRTFKMSGNVISKALSAWEKYMGYALNVTDEAAKGSVEGRVQSGLDKLYEQGRIKDNTLRDGGAQEARYRTFQDDSVFSQVTTGVRNALNKAHVGKVGLGDVLIPFAQVPANLAGRAVDYSPVGLTKGAPDLANVMIKAKNGTLTAAEQAKAVQEIGRGITGSAAIALFTALAAQGIIKVENPGGEDENKDKAAYEKMQGLTGTQFNLSAFVRLLRGESTDWQNGDELMSIAFLEPFNAHMTIGALLAEDMLAEGQLTPETVLKDSFAGTLAAISDMPLFSAFGDAYDAFQYSDKERLGERILDAGNTLLANEVSSIIPNAVKGIAQGLDPYQRDLYSKDGAWAQTADQFRAIFDRDSLPVKQDPYGRPVMNEGGVRNFLNTNILPGQLTTYKETDLDRAIQKTFEETGKAAIFPTRKAPDKITVDGETVELTPEQQRKYQEYYGQKELDTRAALFADDLYENLDNANALKAQGFAEDYAKQTAKEGLLVGFEPEKWVRELAGKTPEAVADGIMLKTFESMAENTKQYDNKYVGISGLLNDGTIDDKVALAIMSDSAVDGYMDYCKKAGVTVADYADVYAYMNKTDDKEATLKYIEGLNMSKAKKVAIAQAIYGANPTFIPIDSDVPKNWLLEMGATNEIVAQFSDSQKELYNRYIRNTGVDMGDYLDIWAFKNSAKSDKDANGKTTYSAQNKTIDQIDRLDISNEDKRNLFLSLGYSEKNIPYWWK